MKISFVLEIYHYKRAYFVSTGKIKLLMNQKIRHHKNFYEFVFFSKFNLYWNLITLSEQFLIVLEISNCQ